jgi:transcriptional regulatory protein GAL4
MSISDSKEADKTQSRRYFLFQAGLVPIICLMCDLNHFDSSAWLNDILITKDLLSRMAITNRLAARCLAVFNRLSPLFDPGMQALEDLGSWEGTYAAGFSDDQFGEGFWDWANREMNRTI